MICQGCHLVAGGFLCERCRSGLRPAPERILHGGIRVVAAFQHVGVARDLVLGLKYRGLTAFASSRRFQFPRTYRTVARMVNPSFASAPSRNEAADRSGAPPDLVERPGRRCAAGGSCGPLCPLRLRASDRPG